MIIVIIIIIVLDICLYSLDFGLHYRATRFQLYIRNIASAVQPSSLESLTRTTQ